MELNGIGELVERIISLVSKLPDEYRVKTFEILLTHFLVGEELAATAGLPTIPGDAVSEKADFVVPIDVRAFLIQFGIDEEVLKKLFYIQGNEVRPIYKITETAKAKAQIQVACLTSLENALQSGKFTFAIESIRNKLRELNAYDGTNFSTNFKNNASLFKGLDEDEVELSSDGKAELAETILEIAK